MSKKNYYKVELGLVSEIIFEMLNQYGLMEENVFKVNETSIHFTIHGIKRWVFCIYVNMHPSGSKKIIRFAGNKLDYIVDGLSGTDCICNQIMNSQPLILNTIEVPCGILLAKGPFESNIQDNRYLIQKVLTYDMIRDLCHLKSNRLITEFSFAPDMDSFIPWIISEYYYYHLRRHILIPMYGQFVLRARAYLMASWLKLKFGKHIKIKSIRNLLHEKGYMPKYQIVYESMDTEVNYYITTKFEKKPIGWDITFMNKTSLNTQQ